MQACNNYLALVEQHKLIDIEKIFKEKNPSAYKWLPKFILRYVQRIAHEEELNNFQSLHYQEHGLDYCRSTVKEFGIKVHTAGIENIPKNGSFILASNHPLGGVDGICLLQEVGAVRPDVRFLVNDVLKKLENFGELFVPVNKLGATSLDNLRRIDAEYASSRGVLIFPAGLVSRRQNGVIKDLDWNRSFIKKSQQYNSPIVPVHLSGQMSNWFYNLSAFRKAIGIKANIEMLYLADEMYKQKGKQLNITIGKPIAAATFGKSKNAQEWANAVRDHVYLLQEKPHLDFV